MSEFFIPLMDDNINKTDIDSLIDFLNQEKIPKLTNGSKVIEFENKWSEWLGTKYNIMVNSGSAANELTMLALKYIYGEVEVIVPPLTWISDISSIILNGLKPVFCDINLKNFSFNFNRLKEVVTPNTKAIFLTHVLGINGLTDEVLEFCKEREILLIEDVCESHGATFNGKKVGSYGFASNFSFYFAHHMTTIEGGIVSTNDEYFYQVCRALRSHGMMREMTDEKLKEKIIDDNPDLNKDFIFIHPAHNFRSTELNAVIGLSQIKKLDDNNKIRIKNFDYFLNKLDSEKYITDINSEGQSNYAFIVVLKNPSFTQRDKIETVLRENKIEFRRGLSGGGNQLRQPFFKKEYKINFDDFPNMEHVHDFGWYVGNYPTLPLEKIDKLISVLNNV